MVTGTFFSFFFFFWLHCEAWERLKAGGDGDDRGWDGWMPSLTQWTWIWVNSGSWWWTGRPGMLQSMGSQGVGHGWVTELNFNKSGLFSCPWSVPAVVSFPNCGSRCELDDVADRLVPRRRHAPPAWAPSSGGSASPPRSQSFWRVGGPPPTWVTPSRWTTLTQSPAPA